MCAGDMWLWANRSATILQESTLGCKGTAQRQRHKSRPQERCLRTTSRAAGCSARMSSGTAARSLRTIGHRVSPCDRWSDCGVEKAHPGAQRRQVAARWPAAIRLGTVVARPGTGSRTVCSLHFFPDDILRRQSDTFRLPGKGDGSGWRLKPGVL